MTERTSGESGASADEPGALTVDSHGDISELTPAQRRAALTEVFRAARACTRCPQLAGARTQVVFGGGNADADLLLVGEAPGAREDELGTPFVGAPGRLLDELLASVGLVRGDVFSTTLLKCRPPGNRDPSPAELERCRDYLLQQVSLVRPRVIVTLGTVPTRTLLPDADAALAGHGRVHVVDLAGLAVQIIPMYHPAAALYTRTLLDTLRDDFAQLAELLARPAIST